MNVCVYHVCVCVCVLLVFTHTNPHSHTHTLTLTLTHTHTHTHTQVLSKVHPAHTRRAVGPQAQLHFKVYFAYFELPIFANGYSGFSGCVYVYIYMCVSLGVSLPYSH